MKKMLALASLLTLFLSLPVCALEHVSSETMIEPRASICPSCGRTGMNPIGQPYLEILTEVEVPCVHGLNGIDMYFEFQEFQNYQCTYCGYQYARSVGPVQSKHDHLIP